VESAVKFVDTFHSHYSELIGNIHSFLDDSFAFCSMPVVILNNYLQSVKIDTQRLEDIKEKYGISERETFNFFAAIDKYWKEDFHEIVLSQILNPKTPEIGNIAHLHQFCDLLSKISGNDLPHKFNSGVIVETQFPVEEQDGGGKRGRIDILIYDNKNSIIIESKINNAPDQDNQLARYFEYIENNFKKKVIAIAYIRPAGDENKMPLLEGYSEKYADAARKVKKLLIPISVVNSQTQHDLCHGFLDGCCGPEKNQKAKVFIQQYSDLLKNLGGSRMLMGIEKDIFRNLFADAESIKKVAAIGEVWENRYLILGALINESLKELGFVPDSERYTYKRITENIKLTFIFDPDWKKTEDCYLFGFSYANDERITDCEDILKEKNFRQSIFSQDILRLDGWVIVKHLYLDCDKPLEEIINFVMDLYKKLEKLAIARLQ
jgi:hypothetical protein